MRLEGLLHLQFAVQKGNAAVCASYNDDVWPRAADTGRFRKFVLALEALLEKAELLPPKTKHRPRARGSLCQTTKWMSACCTPCARFGTVNLFGSITHCLSAKGLTCTIYRAPLEVFQVNVTEALQQRKHVTFQYQRFVRAGLS